MGKPEINHRQYGNVRVKFTLTKLQEDVSKNGAETNYSDSENHVNSQKKKKETQLFTIQTHRGQANSKPKAEQKAFQIKTFRQSAYGTLHKNFGKLLLSP